MYDTKKQTLPKPQIKGPPLFANLIKFTHTI